MQNKKINCPCKRIHCQRHGNCIACKEYHHTDSKALTACERLSKKVDISWKWWYNISSIIKNLK